MPLSRERCYQEDGDMPLCRERCYREDRNEPLCRERCYYEIRKRQLFVLYNKKQKIMAQRSQGDRPPVRQEIMGTGFE